MVFIIFYCIKFDDLPKASLKLIPGRHIIDSFLVFAFGNRLPMLFNSLNIALLFIPHGNRNKENSGNRHQSGEEEVVLDTINFGGFMWLVE